MSIISVKESVGWIIDHEEKIKNMYTSTMMKNSSLDNFTFKSFALDHRLFEIVTPYLCMQEAKSFLHKNLRRKRKHAESYTQSQVNLKEVPIVKSALKEFGCSLNEINHLKRKPSQEDFEKNNEIARKSSSTFFNEVCQMDPDEFSGGNNSDKPILVNIKGNEYLIPNNSEFFCCDIARLINSLSAEKKFDFILMDPPWWNKYVRRRKKYQESAGYKMMYDEDVCSLPVDQWLAPEALVAVWCTNCVRHVDNVVTKWFPKWGLRHVATWYWLKVTRSGVPVCQFSPPPGKQPFERILFGAVEGRSIPQPPDNQCIISVPSAIHSHKPPLTDVMKSFLPENPKCLELFARYLLPHWTSAGNQVLALQNVKLYTYQ